MEPKILTGEEYHMKAEEKMEAGDFVGALENTDRATVKYQSEKNVAKLAEVQASRALIFRHLFEQTDDSSFVVLANASASAGVQIAKVAKISELAIPLYNLGKCQESLGEIEQAVSLYKEALENFSANPGQPQDRPAVVAEMKTRLAVAEFKLGVQDAREQFNSALEELKNAEEPNDYNKKVWVSGAYMHMAEALVGKDNEKAKALIEKAREIIGSDEHMKLRKGQIEKLSAKIA